MSYSLTRILSHHPGKPIFFFLHWTCRDVISYRYIYFSLLVYLETSLSTSSVSSLWKFLSSLGIFHLFWFMMDNLTALSIWKHISLKCEKISWCFSMKSLEINGHSVFSFWSSCYSAVWHPGLMLYFSYIFPPPTSYPFILLLWF